MSTLSIGTKYRMNSGYEIPALGYGIDSAVFYLNEEPCGQAITKSGIPRSELFFTSKVFAQKLNYDYAKQCIQDTLKKSGLDYVDLYLIHAPYGGPEGRIGAWKAMVEAQKEGKIRSLGVSNYGIHHLQELENYIKEEEAKKGKGSGGEISVGQWEVHPWLARPEIVEWCEKRGIIVEAYCPVIRGQRFDEPVLKQLAKKHSKTPAQILLRWSLQKGFVPLPKSVTKARIEENAKLYDFELTKEDLESLNTGAYAPIAWDPTISKLEE
ncbi:MAG: hypothetical protein M1819_004083 [Sarea resinae]|nr:MAG: hypothetical protein M1819_004083 [Sarea resinae]